jgi:hypothetical protein
VSLLLSIAVKKAGVELLPDNRILSLLNKDLAYM